MAEIISVEKPRHLKHLNAIDNIEENQVCYHSSNDELNSERLVSLLKRQVIRLHLHIYA